MGAKGPTKGGAGEQRPGLKDMLSQRAEAHEDDDDSGGFSPWMFLLIGGVVYVMFNRRKVGALLDGVLGPLIGFDSQNPALTIFFASLITGVSSGLIRHYMVDWMDMAKTQAKMKAFQNELKEAQDNDNTYRVKKLTELQPKVMKEQTSMTGQQFKPMAFTMVIVIPMFGWLWTFIRKLNDPSIAAPWGGRTMLLDSAPIVGFIPTWILIYSLFSIPIGQLVQKGLKAYEFSRKLEEESAELSEAA